MSWFKTRINKNLSFPTCRKRNYLMLSFSFLFLSDFMGQLRVFSVKVALATLCNSKPLDKLRCEY